MSQELPETGSRVVAPWLPGVCIYRGNLSQSNNPELIFRVEETGHTITRRPTTEQLEQLQLVDVDNEQGGDAWRFRLGIEALRLRYAHRHDPYFALSTSRVDPLPHQLEAVYMHMLEMPIVRFLLGDDAGAGKTIMAGLLLRELTLRGLADRVLVIAPANLCFQWRREMKELFNMQFETVSKSDVDDVFAQNPFDSINKCVVSRDWVKRENVLEALLAAEPWNLVIIDEAHGMGTSDPEHPTQRYLLAREISARTEHLLMMTATPHNGDVVRFSNFLALLDPEAYADPSSLELAIRNREAPFYLRRLKEHMRSFPDEESPLGKPLFTKREVKTVAFEITQEEMDVYNDLTIYLRRVRAIARRFDERRARAFGFMVALYQRRFASSPHALKRSLERRQKRLTDIIEGKGVPRNNRRLDLEAAEDLDDESLQIQAESEEDEQLSVYDRAMAEAEHQLLVPLLERINSLVETDTTAKWDCLSEMLGNRNGFDSETHRKLLIFTEHKDTLDWLNEKIQNEGYTTVCIHGGMKAGSHETLGTRLWAEEQFRREDGAQVLIATEAAGEGINLQFCWRMVNWDVPWNPARLEQRMGRIHRYKQKRDVIAFNLIARNTREGQVLERLQEKIEEIRRALDPENEGRIFDVVQSVVSPNLVESLMRKVYEQNMEPDEAIDAIDDEVTEEKFKAIIEHTLENLSATELNLGFIRRYHAEARLRRLVPEVLRDFFLESADKLLRKPVTKKKNGQFTWKVPNEIYRMRRDLMPFGELMRNYTEFTFDKEELDQNPHLIWVTPGHPLYEAMVQYSTHASKDDFARGACFIDPEDGPSRWLVVNKVELKDGNDQVVDERLVVLELLNDEERTVRVVEPTVFLDLIPREGEHPIPSVTRDDDMVIDGVLFEHLTGPGSLAEELGTRRSEKAEKVALHVKSSLEALITKEMAKFENYEREQDKRACLERVEGYQIKMRERITKLHRQGQVTIGEPILLARAYVEPLSQVGSPGQERGAGLRRNDEVERAAIDHVTHMELARPEVTRVESRELDGVGYDLEIYGEEDMILRFVEVKGKTTNHDGILTPNEWRVAERLREQYHLVVVTDPIQNPQVMWVQDPFGKMSPSAQVEIHRWFFDMAEVERIATGGPAGEE